MTRKQKRLMDELPRLLEQLKTSYLNRNVIEGDLK